MFWRYLGYLGEFGDIRIMKIIKKLLLIFVFLGISPVFGTDLEVLSAPKLEDSKSVVTANGKYTNQKYTSPDEPSVGEIYRYCLEELLRGQRILHSDRHYYRQTDHGPNLLAPGANIESLIQKNPIAPTSFEPKITWLQHASFLIQINNVNILVDPLIYNSSKLYPSNFEPIYEPEDLPVIDVILISHNHGDHMDPASLIAIREHSPEATVCVPVGNGDRVKEEFGFENVFEFGWQNTLSCTKTGSESQEVTFTFLPAIHWSSVGLGPRGMNKSHWGSWMISSGNANTDFDFNIYFAGDTFYNQKLFQDIKEQFPNIDVAIIGISPNRPRGSVEFVHLDAESAVKAFIDLGAKYLIPMHWGLIRFGTDFFNEPIGRLLTAWEKNIEQLQNKELGILPFGGDIGFEFAQ